MRIWSTLAAPCSCEFAVVTTLFRHVCLGLSAPKSIDIAGLGTLIDIAV